MRNVKRVKEISINIANLLAPIISSRDIIDILEKSIKKTDSRSVNLDFINVKFISRSAAHALLLMKERLQTKKEKSSPLWQGFFVNLTSKHGLIYLKWQEVRPAEAESKGRVYWFFFLPFSLSLNRRFFVKI